MLSRPGLEQKIVDAVRGLRRDDVRGRLLPRCQCLDEKAGAALLPVASGVLQLIEELAQGKLGAQKRTRTSTVLPAST